MFIIWLIDADWIWKCGEIPHCRRYGYNLGLNVGIFRRTGSTTTHLVAPPFFVQDGGFSIDLHLVWTLENGSQRTDTERSSPWSSMIHRLSRRSPSQKRRTPCSYAWQGTSITYTNLFFWCVGTVDAPIVPSWDNSPTKTCWRLAGTMNGRVRQGYVLMFGNFGWRIQ